MKILTVVTALFAACGATPPLTTVAGAAGDSEEPDADAVCESAVPDDELDFVVLLELQPATPEMIAHIGECPANTSAVTRTIGVGHSDIADVVQIFCQLDDGTRHGPAVSLFGDVAIERGSYEDGLREGPWQFHDFDGTATRAGPYSRGRRHGEWTSLHANGALAWRGAFVCGKRRGLFVWWHPDGSEQQRRDFE